MYEKSRDNRCNYQKNLKNSVHYSRKGVHSINKRKQKSFPISDVARSFFKHLVETLNLWSYILLKNIKNEGLDFCLSNRRSTREIAGLEKSQFEKVEVKFFLFSEIYSVLHFDQVKHKQVEALPLYNLQNEGNDLIKVFEKSIYSEMKNFFETHLINNGFFCHVARVIYRVAPVFDIKVSRWKKVSPSYFKIPCFHSLLWPSTRSTLANNALNAKCICLNNTTVGFSLKQKIANHHGEMFFHFETLQHHLYLLIDNCKSAVLAFGKPVTGQHKDFRAQMYQKLLYCKAIVNNIRMESKERSHHLHHFKLSKTNFMKKRQSNNSKEFSDLNYLKYLFRKTQHDKNKN